MQILNRVGPKEDPCGMNRGIPFNEDNSDLYFTI